MSCAELGVCNFLDIGIPQSVISHSKKENNIRVQFLSAFKLLWTTPAYKYVFQHQFTSLVPRNKLN